MIKHFQHRLNKNIKKTKSINRLCLLVVNRFNNKNVKVEDVDCILQNHIINDNKTFLFFKCYCELFKIDMVSCKIKLGRLYIYNVYLTEMLQAKYNYSSSDILDMKKVFITNLQNPSYKHYLQQPKQMIEWCLIKKIIRILILRKCLIDFPYRLREK